MRDVGPHRYPPGTPIGRWTVVRAASNETRAHGRDHIVTFRRVLVRCVCGRERVAEERDLQFGRSRGCRSASCRWVWKVRREVVEVELAAQYHEGAAAAARARLAEVKAKLERHEMRAAR